MICLYPPYLIGCQVNQTHYRHISFLCKTIATSFINYCLHFKGVNKVARDYGLWVIISRDCCIENNEFVEK